MAEGPAIEHPSITLDPVAEVPELELTAKAVLLHDAAEVKPDGVVSLAADPITRVTEPPVALAADLPAPQSTAPAAIGPNSQASVAAETTPVQSSSVSTALPIRSVSVVETPTVEISVPARAAEPTVELSEPQPIAASHHETLAMGSDDASLPPDPSTRAIEPGFAPVAADMLSLPQSDALTRLDGTPLSMKMAIYAVLASLAVLAFRGRPYPAIQA